MRCLIKQYIISSFRYVCAKMSTFSSPLSISLTSIPCWMNKRLPVYRADPIYRFKMIDSFTTSTGLSPYTFITQPLSPHLYFTAILNYQAFLSSLLAIHDAPYARTTHPTSNTVHSQVLCKFLCHLDLYFQYSNQSTAF